MVKDFIGLLLPDVVVTSKIKPLIIVFFTIWCGICALVAGVFFVHGHWEMAIGVTALFGVGLWQIIAAVRAPNVPTETPTDAENTADTDINQDEL